MVERGTPLAAATSARQVRVRLNLSDTAGHSLGWVDTTTSLLAHGGQARGDSITALGRVTLVAPAGTWRYQAALSDGDSLGRVLPSGTLSVGDFDGARLAVSDLVLSTEGRGAPWTPTPGDTAYFDTGHAWLRGDTISLYHEIYGLEPGAAYSARLLVRGGRRVALTLGWHGVADETVTRVKRTLTFSTVRPGNYLLEMEVTDARGRTARSVSPVTVRD
jgi:hypothetical protein